MEVKCNQTLARCIIPAKADGNDMPKVSVCTWPDAILWCCLWWCKGFAMPNTCHAKCYYIPILTCLSVIVILLRCCTPPFPTSPAMFLFSAMICVICTTFVLQGCHSPLFIHPLLNSTWQCFYLSLEKSQNRVAVFSLRERELYLWEGSFTKRFVQHQYCMCLVTLCQGHLPTSFFSQGSWD